MPIYHNVSCNSLTKWNLALEVGRTIPGILPCSGYLFVILGGWRLCKSLLRSPRTELLESVGLYSEDCSLKANTPMQSWIWTKLKIVQLTFKRRFRRKRSGENRNRYKHSDTCTEHLTNSLGNKYLKSLPKCTVFNWNSRSVIAILVNIQSVYLKLDTIIHHMQIENINMAFVTETCINKKEELQLITSQLKCFGYNIITENRMTRKGGGLSWLFTRMTLQ